MIESAFRPDQYDDSCVCTLLVDTEGNIIAQQRDDKPGINSPGMISFFGGFVERDDASLDEAALRELSEETNLRLTKDDIEFFDQFIWEGKRRQLTTMFIAKGVPTDGLEVYEGQGFVRVHDVDEPKLSKVFQHAAPKWFAERDHIYNATAADTDVHRCANTLFVTTDGKMYGQQRDDKPGIDQPGKISGFGGAAEGDETPLQTAVRELGEETNLNLTADDLKFFGRWVLWRPLTKEYEQANVYIAYNVDVSKIEVYEGQGIAPITELNDAIAAPMRPAVQKWFAEPN